MDRYGDIIDKLLNWARLEENVRALIIVGSQARTAKPADIWSDLDAVIVVKNPLALIDNVTWLNQFGKVVCSFTEGTAVGHWLERRVLYSDNRDIDFALLPPDAFVDLSADSDLASVLSRGYRVFLDKDGLTASFIGTAPIPADTPPTSTEYNNAVNDFNYHLIWVSKKIMRGELWTATACINMYLANLLLGMMAWYSRYCQDERVDTWHGGRFLELWAPQAVLDRLKDCITHYSRVDAVKKLDSLRKTYRDLAESVGKSLHYRFPDEVFDGIEGILAATGLSE
jgi:aminoglycoside 6-adenylyltransferase